jgi:hypothetical protein
MSIKQGNWQQATSIASNRLVEYTVRQWCCANSELCLSIPVDVQWAFPLKQISVGPSRLYHLTSGQCKLRLKPLNYNSGMPGLYIQRDSQEPDNPLTTKKTSHEISI